jgi:hypothetical protein
MSIEGLSPEQVAQLEELAALTASDDYEPGPAAEPDRDLTDADAEEFVARWVPPDLVEAARARSRGRPRLPGTPTGASPSRRVRLPADVDARLTARAAAEGRPMSAILRDAVSDYLLKAG